MNTAYEDQIQAAAAHAGDLGRRVLEQQSDVITEGVINASQVPALAAWNDLMMNHFEDALFCEHVGDSPMPVFGRIDTPGTIVCLPCFALLLAPLHDEKDTGLGTYTCDGCGDVAGWLTQATVQHGATVLLGHLCDVCMGKGAEQ
ncbi:hypothetical protein [Microbacterium sp.]|uniref:hypothetical protein n=1 Tax=Microbacterium sp. TaxID=51671 RepID=UPI003A8DBA30